ncbi:MAG: 4-hydroxy-3-methylbut-2-en-1-yl diphosphate synthase [Bacteroidetes bacterium HGW-Bacteroidetes-4]|jgi:(E)-4-hydroxy-3-methylbut-2-enyl-diphosphate synthase|nr:MAG: 4-hydroxy-3-methylbut-2-en-1-yl diphosphate synthase [Bacteroidetes bacterium HGW-Bacteroidetes-4]
MDNSWFTPYPFYLQRHENIPAKVGSLYLGGAYPIRIQSMANTSTHDVDASVNQAIAIIEAGGELVRYTVINSRDAEALKEIKAQLLAKGYPTPIVADIHFNPALADIAAQYVDKVRINPGNYLDKRASFTKVEFTDAEYQEELTRIKARFVAFLTICKEHQTAIRIGTNHGSLSDRIMSRYGDSPTGMVEATMEFLRICHSEKFNNVVVSMKSSNTRVMVYAYRLLAQAMKSEGMNYALHLGVTEAGSGEDGRIKSAVGMGALMHDGLGDTLRVSLTEHPAKEIPVARALVKHFAEIKSYTPLATGVPAFNPYAYNKRPCRPFADTALVVADLSAEAQIDEICLANLGFEFQESTQSFRRSDLSADVVYIGEQLLSYRFNSEVKVLIDCNYWDPHQETLPLFTWEEYKNTTLKSTKENWVQVSLPHLADDDWELIKNDATLVLVAFSYHAHPTQELRVLINQLMLHRINHPLIIQQSYKTLSAADFMLQSAADNGVLFIDGMADGIWLKNTFKSSNKEVVDTAFAILQASRTRITKTEYISCPSCGRTLFDLEKSLTRVKEATAHLKGLKIAVMGCIVNGPGEMADADYGYVGTGPGKVSLYKGKELVKRSVDAEKAVAELLLLIEQDQHD